MPLSRDQNAISRGALVEPALDDAWIFGGRRLNRFGRRSGWRLPLRARLCRRRRNAADLDFAAARLELRRAGRGGAGRSRAAGAAFRCRAGCVAGFGRLSILSRFAVSDELVVTRRAGPWRSVCGQTAGPMRHMIGHKAGKWSARTEHCVEAKQSAQNAKPFGPTPCDDHNGRRVIGPARRMNRALLIVLSNFSPDYLAGH
jgi:hypothetical protein